MSKTICPRCRGNGFLKVKRSIEDDEIEIVQCPMCKSEGETMLKEEIKSLKKVNEVQRVVQKQSSLLTKDLVHSLIEKIRMLQKQKKYLQDKLREKKLND